MATTQTIQGIDQIKGLDPTGTLRAYQIPVLVSGTYTNAGRPTFNVLAALQNSHEGATAVAVVAAGVLDFRDYNDGTSVYTAANANIVLANVNAGCTNDGVTFQLHSGAINGATGVEVANATPVNGVVTFLVLCTVTGVN